MLRAERPGGGVGPAVAVRVLGPLEVDGDHAGLTIASAKQRTLLVLLAVRAGEVVGRSELVDALWAISPRPPPSGLFTATSPA